MKPTSTPTPGPWKLRDGQTCSVRSATPGRQHVVIATLPHVNGAEWPDRAEQRANGALLAASPYLLAACRAAGEWLNAHAGALPPHGEVASLLLAAIAQAEEPR